MVDFRKWLIALAAVGLLLGIGSSTANAQGGNPSFACTAAPVNNIIRAEGVAELVGDMILNCTGGVSTNAGSPIPLSNVQVSINTTITSRIMGSFGNNASEALLMIDDPFPSAIDPMGGNGTYTAVPGGHATAQLACLADNSTNCAIPVSPGNGFGTNGPYNGTTSTGFNVFQGVQITSNAIAWTGVPIDAPGTTYTRIIRITNVRADANQLGVASTLVPTQISMLVSVNGSTSIGSVNVTGAVATIYPGILTPPGATVSTYVATSVSSSSPSGAAAAYQVCNSVNTYLSGFGGSITDFGIGVTVTEGFAYAWRPQQYNQIHTVQSGGADYMAPGTYASTSYQDEPGVNYNSESGFMPNAAAGSIAAGYIGATTNEAVGLADTGTRLQFAVAGVGSGITLYVPSYLYLGGNYGTNKPLGLAVLVGAGGATTGAFSSGTGAIPVALAGSATVTAGGVPTHATEVAVTPVGTAATVTYEIYYSDPSVQESLTVPVSVSYTANTATGVPAATTSPATVTVSFSPQNTTVFPAATTTTPIPRFGPSGSPVNLFSISACNCDLLFPFVTSAAGFDTGIAIANTTSDPFGTINQSGTVTLNYYGTTSGGGANPPSATSGVIAAGQELVFDVYSGGSGIAATPGFTGYIIAQANFQYCHGYAFISDLGAQKLAEGYLAIVLNPYGLYRKVAEGENLSH